MRKTILCLLILLLLSMLCHATETEALEKALPQEIQEHMEGVQEGGGFGEGLLSILESFSLTQAVKNAMKSVGIMLAAVCLCAVAGQDNHAATMAGVLTIAAAGMLELNTMVRAGQEALETLQSFGDLLLPAMATATAASGSIQASTALYAGTVLCSDVLLHLMGRALFPMIYAYVALRAAQAVWGQEVLGRLSDLIKWAFSLGIKTVLFLYIAYLAITGLISGAADATTVKAAKLALSGVVPVVGSMISDASETVLVGAAALKNSVGVFGMLAVCAICLEPFLQVGVQYLLLKLAGAAGGALGQKPLLSLMDGLCDAMGFALALLGTGALFLLIACICYLKVVPG